MNLLSGTWITLNFRINVKMFVCFAVLHLCLACVHTSVHVCRCTDTGKAFLFWLFIHKCQLWSCRLYKYRLIKNIGALQNKCAAVRFVMFVPAFVTSRQRVYGFSWNLVFIGSGVLRNFVRGGGVSTNSVEDSEQRKRGSGGGSPLVRGSGGSCNLVQEI